MTHVIQVDNALVPVHPTTLFQRISYVALEKFLMCNLGPYCLFLFDDALRKGNKSALDKAFKSNPFHTGGSAIRVNS